MARRLGAWDCPYCGSMRILGNVFDCPGCSRPRPRGIRFYQIPDGPVVTPEITQQLGSGGPNWYCEHCDSGNKDNNNKCWNCGADKGSSPSHEVKEYLQGERVPQSTEEAEAADPRPHEMSLAAMDVEPETHTSAPITDLKHAALEATGFVNLKLLAITGAVIVGLVLLAVIVYQAFFNTHNEKVRVNGFYWERHVVVQEYQVVHDSSWSAYPADAYNVSPDYRDTGRDEKIHDGWVSVEYIDTCYQTVPYQGTCTGSQYVSQTCTGTRDGGDGSFETYPYECGGYESYTYSCTLTREEPYACTKTRQEEVYHYEDIYDWYYTYDVNRWVAIADYPTSGDDQSPYYYSDFPLSYPYNGGTPQIGQQQHISLPGKYAVAFFCKGNPKVGDKGYFTRDYALEEWQKFEYEVDYLIEVNAFNGILTYPVP